MKDKKTKFIALEKRGEGKIGLLGTWGYMCTLRAAYWMLPLIFILIFVSNISELVFRYFVSLWIDGSYEKLYTTKNLLDKIKNYFFFSETNQILVCLFIFSVWSVFIIAINWAVSTLFLVNGARILHHKMVQAFLNVRMSFFDENPSGRLVRRFSGDYFQLTDEIPNLLIDIGNNLIAIVIVCCVVLFQAPVALLAIIPCAILYYKSQNIFKSASREIQRYSKILETPIWSLFAETTVGYQVIRAFGKTKEFNSRISKLSNIYGKAALIQSRFLRWLHIRIKMSAEFFAFIVTITVIYFVSNNIIGIGQAGFLMSITLGLDATMQWLARSLSLIDSKMVSVERVLEYSQLTPESNLLKSTADEIELKKLWPKEGNLEFINYSAAYRADLPYVLKNVNFSIPAGKKVGIVGRTGAGKSTIFQALFRMLDKTKGSIMVDGIDILTLSLQTARSIFAVVPQDPHLLSGTIKSNLDRTGYYTEKQMWDALKEVELYNLISKLPGGLNYVLSERGLNFSVGERQLLCLARAILINAKIILMDEATASVDTKTDELIYKTIERSFKGKTLLVIAHRLDTIENADIIWRIE